MIDKRVLFDCWGFKCIILWGLSYNIKHLEVTVLGIWKYIIKGKQKNKIACVCVGGGGTSNQILCPLLCHPSLECLVLVCFCSLVNDMYIYVRDMIESLVGGAINNQAGSKSAI